MRRPSKQMALDALQFLKSSETSAIRDNTEVSE